MLDEDLSNKDVGLSWIRQVTARSSITCFVLESNEILSLHLLANTLLKPKLTNGTHYGLVDLADTCTQQPL